MTSTSPPAADGLLLAGKHPQSTNTGGGLFKCFSYCWSLMQLCNLAITTVLVLMVVYMMGQIEHLQVELDQQHETVDTLREQVQTKQEGQIQELHQAVEENHTLTITTLAGTFTLVTCLISMFHMTSHIQHYHEPRVQTKIMAILFMSPIYSVTSLLSLMIPPIEVYLAIVKDFYESYCIYTFLAFLIAVMGRRGAAEVSDDAAEIVDERDAVVHVLANHANHLARPSRCLRSFYHPPPETSDLAKANAVLTECQIMAMQFVFIRPLTSIANCVMTLLEESELKSNPGSTNDDIHRLLQDEINETIADPGYDINGTATFDGNSTTPILGGQEFQQATINYFTSPGFCIAMVTNVSVFFAFTGLLKFYHAVRNDLAWCQPFSKFLTIKGVVFLTFWQGLAIRIIVSIRPSTSSVSPSARAVQIQNVLICLEMLFFSITHWCVFPAEEWAPGYETQKKQIRNDNATSDRRTPGIGLQDFVDDVSQIYRGRRRTRRRGGDAYEIQPGGGMGIMSQDDMTDMTEITSDLHLDTELDRSPRGGKGRSELGGEVELPEIQ